MIAGIGSHIRNSSVWYVCSTPLLLVLTEESLILPHVCHRHIIGSNLLENEQRTTAVAVNHRQGITVSPQAPPRATLLGVYTVHAFLPLDWNELQALILVAVRRIPKKRILYTTESHIDSLTEVRTIQLTILHISLVTAQLPHKIFLGLLFILIYIYTCIVGVVATCIECLTAFNLTDNEIAVNNRQEVHLVLLHIFQAEMCIFACSILYHLQRAIALHLEYKCLTALAKQLDNTLSLIDNIHHKRLVIGTCGLPLQQLARSTRRQGHVYCLSVIVIVKCKHRVL